MRVGKKIYSRSELAFVERHKDLVRAELHRRFIDRFGRHDISFYNVEDLCARNGWHNRRTHREFSRAERAFVKRNSHLKRRELLKLFLQKFDRSDVAFCHLNDLCRRERWHTGRVSMEKPVGSERLCKGYVEISIGRTAVSGHGRFVLKHRWLWELKHGPIAQGFNLKCKSADITNTDPSNWECVPKGLIGRLRKRGYADAPDELKPMIMAVAKLEHRIRERSHGR